jgi:hypothetical protein
MTKAIALRSGLTGLALLASAVGVACSAKAQAGADDSANSQEEFGCTVLLCMMNPAGPYAVAECAPAVSQFFAMAKSGSRPTCSAAGWSGQSATYAPVDCSGEYSMALDETGAWGCRSNDKYVVLDEYGQPVPDGMGGVVYDHKFTTDPSVMTHREKTHYFDLTFDGQTTRVWF